MRAGTLQKYRITTTSFASVYPPMLPRLSGRGRPLADTDAVIRRLTGYSDAGLRAVLAGKTDFDTFFAQVPALNSARALITGVVCGVRVEEVAEPTPRGVRYLDRLIDELAHRLPLEKILGEG